MTSKKESEPVSIGYRSAGLFFGFIGLFLVATGWLVHASAGWITALVLLVVGAGLLIPSLGMLFARNQEQAKRWSSWLLIDLFIPV